MQFAHPNVLWLLLVIPPAMIAFYVWAGRKRQALITAFIRARLLPSLLAGDSGTRRNIRFGLLVAAVCWIVVALARPQWGFTWEEVRQRGLDIVIAIDVSKSMLAEDIQPNRLARAKLAALDLLKQARSDRVGLVAFSGSAFLQCPLTIDDSVFRQSLAGLDVNTISRGGTAISEAIEAAMGAFTESENYKVLVLLTDGEDHDSGALETARQAAAKGLEIFTIGVGTTEGELLRVQDASGKSDFIRDEEGNVVKSRLNERILQELAGTSSRGFYLPLRGPEVIDTLYAKGLAPIPKSEAGEKLVKRYHEQFKWPLGVAILLLIVEVLYPERKRQRQSGKKTTPLPATRAVALWIVLLLAFPFELRASTGSAFRDYQSGEYERALQEYQQLLERKPSDPRLHFNAGAAAYKGGLFNEAARHFNEATAAQDIKLQQQAYYNRGNALFQSGEAIPDPSKRSEFWNQALRDYDTALKLEPNDSDAAHNREYVKRRLEELKQQQEQQKQQKQDQNKDEQQDQQDQQQQSSEQQQDNKDQQRQQDQQSQQEKQDDQQNQQQQEQDQNQPREQDQQQQQQEEERSAAEDHVPGQMSPAQARQLLDAEKGDEKLLQFKPREEPSKGRPLRDW
jgi:Ca-activated chloride channel homolog